MVDLISIRWAALLASKNVENFGDVTIFIANARKIEEYMKEGYSVRSK